MYTVYIIQSKSSGKRYIGHTDNLEKRLNEHNAGANNATKLFSDWELIYSERLDSRSLAIKREKFFKTGDGRKVLKNKGIY